MTQTRHLLVLGAAYGLLPAVRMAQAGHCVTVMCRAEEQADLAAHGAKISFLRRDGQIGQTLTAPAERGPSTQAGRLGLIGADVDPAGFDMVFSALAEPHLAAPEIGQLFARIAAARRPLVVLANLLPLPFLARFAQVDLAALRPAYQGRAVWAGIDPDLVTAASPDAQAVRADPACAHHLTVTLASNFKIAPFVGADHQQILAQIAADVGAFRQNGLPLPVRMMAQASAFVPLAKWPMLMTGNCRSVTLSGPPRPIADAVGDDPDQSRQIYDHVTEIIRRIGADAADIVPFVAYASAAKALTRPSSLARALAKGATEVERIDLMIARTAAALALQSPLIDTIVAQIEARLATNRAAQR